MEACRAGTCCGFDTICDAVVNTSFMILCPSGPETKQWKVNVPADCSSKKVVMYSSCHSDENACFPIPLSIVKHQYF